jgi:hypothetical protein
MIVMDQHFSKASRQTKPACPLHLHVEFQHYNSSLKSHTFVSPYPSGQGLFVSCFNSQHHDKHRNLKHSEVYQATSMFLEYSRIMTASMVLHNSRFCYPICTVDRFGQLQSKTYLPDSQCNFSYDESIHKDATHGHCITFYTLHV